MRVQPQVVVLMGQLTARAVMGMQESAYVDMDTHHGRLIGQIEYAGDAQRWVWGFKPAHIFGWAGHSVLVHNPGHGVSNTAIMMHILNDFRALGDILQCLQTGHFPDLVDPYPFPTYKELTDPAEVWASLLPQYSATHGRIIATDTETDGKGGAPWCLSYSTAPGTGYVIPADAKEALRVWHAHVTSDPYILTELHNAPFDIDVLAAMGITGYKWRDTMHTAYQLAYLPQGLKPLASRLCGMKMQDYGELVQGPSVPPVVDWAREVDAHVIAATPQKQPRKKLVYEPYHKEWRKQARLLRTQIAKTDKWHDSGGSGGADFPDPWKWWEARTPETKKLLSVFGHGPMPVESIVHVPRVQAVHYAARDADATLRVRLAVRRLVRELQHKVTPPGKRSIWDVAATGTDAVWGAK